MNESNVNLSWLGLPAPKANEAPAEAQQPNHQADLGSTSGQSPGGAKMLLLAQIRKRVRTSDYWTVPPGGAPSHRRSLLTDALLDRHLNGGHRVGACPTERGQNTTRLALFDLDSHGGEVDWSTMCGVASEIIASAASHGLRAIPVRSSGGQGIHLLFIWNDPQDARSVRRLLGQVLDECGLKNGTRGVRHYEVEIFPKQDSVPADGWGSMFVLPFAGKSVALDRSTLQEIDPGALKQEASDPVPVVEPEPVRAPSSIEVPPEIADVRDALAAIDPNDYDYEGWVKLLFSVHAGTDGSEEGFAVFDAWSQRFARYTREETEKQWRFARSNKAGGITIGTLFAEAAKRGWVHPLRRPSAEGLTNLVEESKCKLIGEAQAADALGMADALPDMAHLVREAAELPEEDRVEVFDQMREVVGDKVMDRFAATVRGADAAIEKAKTRFKSEPLAAFAQRPGIAWLIKHVLPRTGLAVIYGAPGSGKSFFALDMVATVARGSEWRGRKVRKGRAMYIAAEGSGGFASRGRAYLQAHGLTEIDLRVIGEAPNFFTGTGDEKHIAEEVRACGGADVIVIDTLSASSAGADENTGKDMNLIVGRMNKLQAATGALVVLVHHSGKDESKGARGWSGLKAAVDVEIEVSRPDDEEPGRVARITKQKDGESGAAFGFELEMVELGLDEDGDPIRSCVVKATDQIPTKRAKTAGVAAERRPRGQWKRMAFDMAKERGTVSIEDVVEKVAAEMPAPEPDKRDQRRGNARRDIDALIRDGFLETTGGGKSLRLAGMGELL